MCTVESRTIVGGGGGILQLLRATITKSTSGVKGFDFVGRQYFN